MTAIGVIVGALGGVLFFEPARRWHMHGANTARVMTTFGALLVILAGFAILVYAGVLQVLAGNWW